jgi:hypothetical protein
VDISDSAVSDGNECQHKALKIAGGRTHGAKPNRVLAGCLLALYRVKSQVTMTSATRTTNTRVTRDFGSAFIAGRSRCSDGPAARP